MERIFKLRPMEQVLVQFLLLAWALVVAIPFGLAFINSMKAAWVR